MFREKLIKSARRNHRCSGCDGFVTILAGDSYYDCFTTSPDPGGFKMCVKCHDHLNECKECSDAAIDDVSNTGYCWRESEVTL